MGLAKIINSILMPLGLVVVRHSTVERLSKNPDSNSLIQGHSSISERLDNIGKNLTDLEVKIDVFQRDVLRHQVAGKWSVIDYISRSIDDQEQSCTCPLCGLISSADTLKQFNSNCIFGGGLLLRYQCPNCDLIFGPKKMLDLTPAELSSDYEWHYRVYDEGDSTAQEIRAFHLLKPSKSGVYLNYGAGAWSKSVEILRSEGWNVMAYEPHGSAQASADYVISSSVELQKIRFDGVFSNNVLEHLRYPVEELSFMREIIKQGGRMSHATPCFEYLYEYTRFHLFFYLGRSRSLLAERANLTVVDFVLDGEFMCALYEAKCS